MFLLWIHSRVAHYKAEQPNLVCALTRNSSLMKYFALVTRESSPGSGVAGGRAAG